MPMLVRLIALALVMACLPSPADAWRRSPATTAATLPEGTAHPEGLTVDHDGNIWVADFDVSKASGPGDVIAFAPSGRLLRVIHPTGSSALLLGLAFHPTTGALLVIDFGSGKVLDVDPFDGTATTFMTAPSLGGGTPGLNALTFDADGNVYVSDSFQGAIFKTGPNGGSPTTWFQSDALLKPNGVPPFGANGLAFNNAGTALFVANTANDTVVRIPKKNDGTADAAGAGVFVNSINGADGLLIDDDDNLWVCANQSDEIVVVDPTGRAIAKLGDFDGIDPRGSPNGLLFPASLAFSRNGDFLYVSNLSLDLRVAVGATAVDSAWTAQVTRHTIAKIPARIPPVPGLP